MDFSFLSASTGRRGESTSFISVFSQDFPARAAAHALDTPSVADKLSHSVKNGLFDAHDLRPHEAVLTASA